MRFISVYASETSVSIKQNGVQKITDIYINYSTFHSISFHMYKYFIPVSNGAN